MTIDVPEEHLLGQFIPLHYHFNMLRDQQRMAPFREAIDLTVPDNGVVLELGGGLRPRKLAMFTALNAIPRWLGRLSLSSQTIRTAIESL
jgi:hypothetical protein